LTELLSDAIKSNFEGIISCQRGVCDITVSVSLLHLQTEKEQLMVCRKRNFFNWWVFL